MDGRDRQPSWAGGSQGRTSWAARAQSPGTVPFTKCSSHLPGPGSPLAHFQENVHRDSPAEGIYPEGSPSEQTWDPEPQFAARASHTGVPHGQQEHRKATVHPASLQTWCFSCRSGEECKVNSRETMGGPATEDDDSSPWMLPTLVAPYPGPGEWPQDSPHICSSSFTHTREPQQRKEGAKTTGQRLQTARAMPETPSPDSLDGAHSVLPRPIHVHSTPLRPNQACLDLPRPTQSRSNRTCSPG